MLNPQNFTPASCHPYVPTLAKPIVIPARDTAQGSPFLQVYPTELSNFDICKDCFFNFLDHLNHAAAAHPLGIGVELAGGAVGLVPEPVAQITGAAVEATAAAATAAAIKLRTILALSKANYDLFAPRGLRARIVKLDAVARAAGICILDEEGKVDKAVRILPSPPTDDDPLHQLTAQAKRLKVLEQWTLPLEIVPLSHPQPNDSVQRKWLQQINAAANEWQRNSTEEKLRKRRVEGVKQLAKKMQKAEERYQESMRKLARDKQRIESKAKNNDDEATADKLRELTSKFEKAGAEYDRRLRESEAESVRSDKEEKDIRKIDFLLITQETF